MQGKHILSMMEFTKRDIEDIIKLAIKQKKRPRPLLKKKILTMIFQKPSTRTRMSFEIAMLQLGGNAIYLTMDELQLSRGETAEDTARTLSVYADAIGARVYDHADIVKIADNASVPVINMLSDMYHPCQILGDLLTIKELKSDTERLKLAWIGDGNNVCNSLIVGTALMGINSTIACPDGYQPHRDPLDFALREAAKNNCSIEIIDDPEEAIKNADIVYTDSFVSMGKEAEREVRLKAFLPRFQVNEDLMKRANPRAIFMHCLPAKRGEEVTSNVIDGKQSVVWLEAENRLHAQKALLCFLLLKNLKGL